MSNRRNELARNRAGKRAVSDTTRVHVRHTALAGDKGRCVTHPGARSFVLSLRRKVSSSVLTAGVMCSTTVAQISAYKEGGR